MPIQLLRPMRSVSLEVPEGADAGTYASLVLDFTEGEQILVGAPLDRGREVRVDPGTPVRLEFAQPDGIHVLATRVLGRSDNQPSLRLAWPERSERIQRRSYARVEMLVRCELAFREPRTGAEGEASALTTNVSAGGVRITAPVPLEPDSQVQITLHLPDVGARTCQAHVTRGGETRGAAENHRYWAALEFVGMLESVRDDLTQFILEAQRDRVRRGLA